MMLYYIYDGSFDGLLTSIYEAYYRKENPERILARQDVQENLFARYIPIATDEEKSNKVYQSIKTRISKTALDNVFYVFLSDLEDAGTWIYQYLKMGWRVGRNVDHHIADERVLAVHKTRQKVLGESHRMLGLIRFHHLSGEIYYAPIEPQYQILGLMAPHFTKRLADQHWIIHDVKRGLGAVYNQKEWVMKEFDFDPQSSFGDKEMEYQRLWREYFQSIAIANRINPRLQKRNMPMRYWKYLIEKK